MTHIVATVNFFLQLNGKILDSIFRKIIMQKYFMFTQSNNVFGVKNIIL